MHSSLKSCLLLLVAALPMAVAAEIGETPRTGYFSIEFTPRELLGEDGAREAEKILRSDEKISWQLYVPDSYDPAAPAGALVYVSPQRKGGPPRRWNPAIVEKNLIWIGANNAGNRTALGKRMFLAMLGPRVLARFYTLDMSRIYIAGFSGGGKTANMVAAASPELFRGGIYIGGAEFWSNDNVPPKLDVIRQNYHVFLTGSNDFNEGLTRRVYASFKNAGVEHSELIVVRRMGHELPPPQTFIRAVDYLDSRNCSDCESTN